MRIVIDPNEKAKPLKVKSPCIGYCTASSIGDKVCIGCYRSACDVDNWNKYTQHQKVITLIRSYHNMKMMKEDKA